MSLPFAITAVENGTALVIPETAFTEHQRDAIAHMIRNRGIEPQPPAAASEPTSPLPKPGPAPAGESFLVQGEIATARGFTGDCCRDCGSFEMVRSGTCTTCKACGSASGGCS